MHKFICSSFNILRKLRSRLQLVIEKIASDVETAMAFANTEIEALKKKELVSENKVKELQDKLLY